MVRVVVQLEPLEPITVYVVVVVGLTVIVEFVCPVDHEKAEAPKATSVAEFPLHIGPVLVTVMLGACTTLTCIVPVVVQLLLLVTETV